MLKKPEKEKIITRNRVHPKDTGSPEVQVSLLTERINELANHLKEHKKDFSSKRGLLKMVIKRKRLLAWLKAYDPKRHKKLVQTLGL